MMGSSAITTKPAAVAAVLLLGVTLAGCAGTTGQAPEATTGPPDWIVRGSGALVDGGKRAFHGVGSVAGVRTKALAETAAANRARAEVTRVFESYAAKLMHDYVAAAGAGNAIGTNTAMTEQQYVDQSVRVVSAATLPGTMIVDRWIDPHDGTVYALARLELDKFHQGLDKAKDLSAPAKAYAKQNADKAFDALAEEQAKRRR
jgi:hypothetical protein